jgi:hypothetical protein
MKIWSYPLDGREEQAEDVSVAAYFRYRHGGWADRL